MKEEEDTTSTNGESWPHLINLSQRKVKSFAERLAARTQGSDSSSSYIPKKIVPPSSLPISRLHSTTAPQLSTSLFSTSQAEPSPTTGSYRTSIVSSDLSLSPSSTLDIRSSDNGGSSFRSFGKSSPSPLGVHANYHSPHEGNNNSSRFVDAISSPGVCFQRSHLYCEENGVRYSPHSPASPLSPMLCDDGYTWRKYGQKYVRGSEHPRSYYKCTHPNCQMKKKLERSSDGLVTDVVYCGVHDHPKPHLSRRLMVTSPHSGNIGDDGLGSSNCKVDGQLRLSCQMDGSNTPDISPTSTSDGERESRRLLVEDVDDADIDSKRRRMEENTPFDMIGATRQIREPRVVVQTTSEIDILDDGYRWRKYGQKVVKGNPNPRSYYKCTNTGCPVRKHVERACHDPRSVITTYEGKHNHDVPSARYSNHDLPTGGGGGGALQSCSASAAFQSMLAETVNTSSFSLCPIPIEKSMDGTNILRRLANHSFQSHGDEASILKLGMCVNKGFGPPENIAPSTSCLLLGSMNPVSCSNGDKSATAIGDLSLSQQPKANFLQLSTRKPEPANKFIIGSSFSSSAPSFQHHAFGSIMMGP